MKVLRSTFVAAAAIFAAACGDKVEIVQPTTNTTPTVNSVTVSPSSVTLSVGQTLTFTAIVDVSNGAATTVTWNTTVTGLTVNTSTGALSAVPASAAGNSGSVCATSTVDANKKGCAQVVIQAASANVPAQVSIASITTGGNLNTPVNPLAVAGQIDVRVNIVPGTQTPTKLELLLGTEVIASQTFTAAQAASLRFAADEAATNQSAFPQILFNVNTAALDANNVPRWTNGARTLSAKLTTAGSTATPTATAQTTLTFANADGWIWAPAAGSTAQGTSGTTANALNASGFRYDRGGITVTVQMVSYSGAVMTGGTMTFGSGCDASAIGARTVTLTGTASPFTATFSATAGAAATNVTNYEFDAGLCGLNAIGETPTVTAVNSNGDALFAAAGPLNAGAVTGLRLDNRAPTNPTLIQNPNGRANGWVNSAIALTTNNGATAATINGVMVNPANAVGCSAPARLDCGITTTARFVRVAASAAGTVAEARSAAASSTPALPAPSVTNTTYCGIFTVQDALGNEAALPAAATVCSAPAAGASTALAANHMLFGVDIANPTIAYTAASIAANNRRAGAAIGGEFIVTVNDTGLVGNSGMLPTSPVLMLIQQRVAGTTPNSAGTTNNLFANGAANAAGTLSATGVAAAAPLYSTAITALAGAANHAYYTHSATAFDAAGNSASVTPRVMVYDNAAPVPGAPSAAVTLTASGYTANAFISEDLDIQDFSFGVNYGALAPFTSATAQIQQPVVAVSGFNAATFANTNFGVSTTVPLPLALQANVAAGLTNMAALNTTARAQSNLAATSPNFVPGVVTPGTAIPLTNFTTFPAITLPAAVTGTVTGNTTAATAANPANVLLTATITGTTAVFNNPFQRMDFYMKDATGTRYFNVGSATAATLNDNGATRTFTFTVTINGATVYALLGGAGATFASDVVAVGIGAANGNIGMVAAGATAINVVF